MSGYTDQSAGRHDALDRDSQFLQKPFTTDDLLAKIRMVLDTSRE
jgi:DNA-binding response OmpR family regulator